MKPLKKILYKALILNFNMDGLPLYKSSNSSLWPTLGTIANLEPQTVFAISLFYGESKPSDLKFLDDFVADLKVLLREGLQFNGVKIPVTVRAFVLDAPARAMVKAMKYCTGYFGCGQCDQKGKRHENRTIYRKIEGLNLRTDHSFREKTNPEHHKGDTPLLELEIDMVKSFPVEYMHQVSSVVLYISCLENLISILIYHYIEKNQPTLPI